MIVALVNPDIRDHGMSTDNQGGCLRRNHCFQEDNSCLCPRTTIHDIVAINVGGQVFQTRRSTLQRYPETLLGEFFNRLCLGFLLFYELMDSFYFSSPLFLLIQILVPKKFCDDIRFGVYLDQDIKHNFSNTIFIIIISQ